MFLHQQTKKISIKIIISQNYSHAFYLPKIKKKTPDFQIQKCERIYKHETTNLCESVKRNSIQSIKTLQKNVRDCMTYRHTKSERTYTNNYKIKNGLYPSKRT